MSGAGGFGHTQPVRRPAGCRPTCCGPAASRGSVVFTVRASRVAMLLGAGVMALVLLASSAPGALVIGVVLAALPVGPVVAAFLWLDRYEPEPLRLLAAAFGWGAVVATASRPGAAGAGRRRGADAPSRGRRRSSRRSPRRRPRGCSCCSCCGASARDRRRPRRDRLRRPRRGRASRSPRTSSTSAPPTWAATASAPAGSGRRSACSSSAASSARSRTRCSPSSSGSGSGTPSPARTPARCARTGGRLRPRRSRARGAGTARRSSAGGSYFVLTYFFAMVPAFLLVVGFAVWARRREATMLTRALGRRRHPRLPRPGRGAVAGAPARHAAPPVATPGRSAARSPSR